MWWPGMDKAIEEVGKGCTEYQLSQNNPQTARPHVWEWPVRPWQRFHVFNVLSPKVIPMASTSAARIMSRGTKEAVSHTWLTRTADEFRTFVRSKGMKHIKSAPYHPNTNGMAERFVQRFKQVLRALTKKKTISRKLTNFLLTYRTTPHALNGEAAAVLLMGRNLRTRLDILKLNIRSGGKTARPRIAVKPRPYPRAAHRASCRCPKLPN